MTDKHADRTLGAIERLREVEHARLIQLTLQLLDTWAVVVAALLDHCKFYGYNDGDEQLLDGAGDAPRVHLGAPIDASDLPAQPYTWNDRTQEVVDAVDATGCEVVVVRRSDGEYRACGVYEYDYVRNDSVTIWPLVVR